MCSVFLSVVNIWQRLLSMVENNGWCQHRLRNWFYICCIFIFNLEILLIILTWFLEMLAVQDHSFVFTVGHISTYWPFHFYINNFVQCLFNYIWIFELILHLDSLTGIRPLFNYKTRLLLDSLIKAFVLFKKCEIIVLFHGVSSPGLLYIILKLVSIGRWLSFKWAHEVVHLYWLIFFLNICHL